MESQLSRAARVLKDVSQTLKEQAHEFISNDTPLEKMLKEATANTNWGCANSMLGLIANASNDTQDYKVIMRYIWEALAAKPRYWRRIFKALTLLEYLLRHGPTRIVDDVTECLYRLKVLFGFQYVESEGKEKGTGIRVKAKQIFDLVGDAELLKTEREKARENRDRYIGMGATGKTTSGIECSDGTLESYAHDNAKASIYYRSAYSTSPAVPSGPPGRLRRVVNRDEERELNRRASEREQARLQREKQKEKTLKRKKLGEKQSAPEKGSKEFFRSGSLSGSSSSSSRLSTASSPPSHLKKLEVAQRCASVTDSNVFNTDVGWTLVPAPSMSNPPSGVLTSSGFNSSFLELNQQNNQRASSFSMPPQQQPFITAPQSQPQIHHPNAYPASNSLYPFHSGLLQPQMSTPANSSFPNFSFPTPMSTPANYSFPSSSPFPARMSTPANTAFPSSSPFPAQMSTPANTSFPSSSPFPAKMSTPANTSFPSSSPFPAQMSTNANTSFLSSSSFPSQMSTPANTSFPTSSSFPPQYLGEISTTSSLHLSRSTASSQPLGGGTTPWTTSILPLQGSTFPSSLAPPQGYGSVPRPNAPLSCNQPPSLQALITQNLDGLSGGRHYNTNPNSSPSQKWPS